MSGSTSSDGSFARAASQPPEDAGEHPLGLTVHTLPAAGAAVADAQRGRYGRLKMLGVLLICAAPVIASYFTYYVVRPEARRSYGELIDPQRTFPDLKATTLDGQTMDIRSLKGQWLLVSVAGGACDAACQKHLYLQRQLREGLGRDKDRLDRVWLVPDSAPVPPALEPALRQATVLRVDAQALAQWLVPAGGRELRDHLYVVDPMGNWMMRFPAVNLDASVDTASAAKIKRDLERLMRGSASWDQAGRPQ